jgi:UDP-glucose 4-epimerase
MRLAITGSSGYLAQQLVGRLAADPDCEYVLGLDIRPGRSEMPGGFSFVQFDLTAPWSELRDLLVQHRIDSGLHLAWQFNPIHDTARERAIDVDGSRNFFRAAAGAGLRRVVYASSTTVYVQPGNPSQPPFLMEEIPPRGTTNYLYSKYKAEVDREAQEFMAAHPGIEVLILRAPIVLGAHTNNIVSQLFDWPFPAFPWVFQVHGADPPLQFLAEEDAGEILYRALKSHVRGVINAAADGVVRFSEVVGAAGKRSLKLPAWLLHALTGVLWALHLSPFPSGILDLMRYPWVADNTRLKTVFGYQPCFTSQEAVKRFTAAYLARY